jgi:amidohydrolase
MNIKQSIREFAPAMVAMRRDLHQHPEIAFEEHRTSGILADHLEQLGLEVQRGVGQTGVVAELRGGQPGKTVLVRADIDALPILEATGASYASQTPGKMHACGHDGHASIAAFVASVFAQNRAELPGQYRFVFQPAEEIVRGATAMLSDRPDLLDGVDACVGLHLWNDKPAGWVGVRPGPVMAAPDAFTVTIHGRGAHAASPHQGIDPIVIGSHLIAALQSIVSREVNPFMPAVITIATLRAGSGAHNIIPESAELLGTLRTFDQDLRPRLQSRITEMSESLARAFGGSASLEWKHGPPAVVNDAKLSDQFIQAVQDTAKVEYADQTMGGDDMAEFLVRKPGVYFYVGSNDVSTGRNKPHHHPGFDIDDERALPLAAELLAKAAISFARD